MPANARLARIDRQLAALEAAAAETATAAARANPVDRLRAELEWLLHPRVIDGTSERDRRYLWPWWQLLRILSDHTNCAFPQLEHAAGHVADAVVEWRAGLLDLARREEEAGGAGDPEGDTPLDTEPGWNPVNVVTLHSLKHRLRIDHKFDHPGWEPGVIDLRNNRHLGIERAEQIDHLLAAGRSPWARDFEPDPDHWPAVHRAEILRRLAASQSLVPDHVPPFDWVEVKVYRYQWPFPRDRDGRPLPSVLEDEGDG